MSFALPFRLPASRSVRVLCVAIILIAAAAVIARLHRRPRPWPAGKVPIAFWAWRNQAPSETDLRKAIEKNSARSIFLRAGQIDYQDEKLRRIRAINGSLPEDVDLHLVYNATRSLLDQLDKVDENTLAGAIADSFQEDAQRAGEQHARVLGVQVDIDVPTRLLGRYEKTLRALRARLKPGTQLSITGLPTWMKSSELQSTLRQVDFWAPQFYGAEIPERIDQLISISSPQDVERFTNDARALDKPFYAGLAAYSCVFLYDKSGSLISLRGSMDPAAIAADTNLELVDWRTFGATNYEWRYQYRARADGVIDGLAMHAGEQLVVDSPSAESLRELAGIVRELAGEKLLGICVFRLPAHDDPATLSAEQVAVALADQDSTPEFEIRFRDADKQAQAWLLKIENQGTAGAAGDLKIDVPVNAGTIESVRVQRGAWFETLCQTPDSTRPIAYQPCGQNRANLLRIAAHGLRPGETLAATIFFKFTPPDVMPISIETRTDAGQLYVNRKEIPVEGGIKR